MKNNLDPRIEEGNKIFTDIERYIAFLDAPFAIRPVQFAADLIKRISNLEAQIESLEPKTTEELFLVELKRRLFGQRQLLEVELSGKVPTLNDIVQTYFIPEEDLVELGEWLNANRNEVQNANQRTFENYTDKRRTTTPLGNHLLRTQAENLIQEFIQKYTPLVKKVFKDIPEFDTFLANYHILTDTSTNRSVSNRFGKVMLISVSATTYIQDGILKVNPELLLSTLNHEVVGHGLNYSITEHSNLPEFIKTGSSEITASTRESLAEYMESYIFEELKLISNITQELSLNESFEQIYTRYSDSRLMDTYWKKLSRYAILTASKLTKNDTQDILKQISDVSIDSGYANRFISRIRNEWHPHSNTLLPSVISELKYCANPVKRVVSESTTIPKLSKHMFTGFWTPTGYQQWTKLQNTNPNA